MLRPQHKMEKSIAYNTETTAHNRNTAYNHFTTGYNEVYTIYMYIGLTTPYNA